MNAQGSYEWLMDRLGHVTASRFHDVLTPPKKKEDRRRGKMSQTAAEYMRQLLAEHLTGEPSEEIHAKSLEWGIRWEPVARIAYEQMFEVEVEQTGFVKHPTEPYIGCSPDGFVGPRGLLQIKCPLTGAQHVKLLLDARLPDEHEEQIYGELLVTDRDWCDFISYHPRFPEEVRLLRIRVERCKIAESAILKPVIAFRNEMLRQLERITDKYSQPEKVSA